MRMTRRSLLGSGVAVGGIAILAACGTAVATTEGPKADMAEAPKAEEAKVMEGEAGAGDFQLPRPGRSALDCTL